MDTRKLEAIKSDMTDMLSIFEELEKKYGVKVSLGRGQYTHTSYTLKLEFSEVSSDGSVQTQEATAFKTMATRYGLKPEYLGQEFVSNGERFTIVGLNPRAHKMPVIGQNAAGKRYKFTAENVRNKLGVPADASVGHRFY